MPNRQGKTPTSRRIRCWSTLVCCWFGFASVAAEPAERHPIPTQVWLPNPERPHAQNWAIAVDGAGEVFVANGNGVLRYDGQHWRLDMPSGVEKWVYDLDLDPDGRVVTGTIDEFGCYQRDANGNAEFDSISRRHGLGDFGMIGRAKATSDGLFFATRSRIYWQDRQGQLSTFERSVGNLLRVGDRIWLDQPDGVQVFDAASRAFKPMPGFEGLRGVPLTDADSPDGRQGWISTIDRGLWRFDADGARHFPSAADALAGPLRLIAVRALPDGRIAVGTRVGGLLLLNRDGSLERIIDQDEGLPGNRITDLALDADGGLWAGIEGGIARLDLGSGVSRYGREQGTSTVMEAVIRHRGQMYAGGAQGFMRLVARDARSARFERIDGPPNAVALWSHASSADLLIGADNGLWRWRAEANAVEQLFEGRRINQLLAAPAQPDLVYAVTSAGLRRFAWRDSAWHSEGSLSGVEVALAMAAFAPDGALWFGGGNGELFRLAAPIDWPEAEVERFGAEHGLPAGSIHPYRIGSRLLIAGAGPLLAPSGPPWTFVPVSQDLNTHRLIADTEAGVYWGSFGQLIERAGRFEQDTSMGRGLGTPKINGLFAEPGAIWYATDVGVLRAPNTPDRRGQHRLRFAGLSLGRAQVRELHSADPFPTRIDLPMQAIEARLRFALPDHGFGDAVQFRHRLQPGAEAWSDWTPEAFADFTRLPYGESVLTVEATDRAGRPALPLVLKLQRPTPWFLTHWAQALYAALALLVIGLAVYAGRRWRVNALEQRAQQLERQVAERTEVIRQQRDELAEQSAARTRFFANVSHEFRTPLTLMHGPLQALREQAAARADGDGLRLVDTALRNSAQMQALVDEVLDLHRLEAGQIKLHRQQLDLGALAAQIAEEFAELAHQRGISLHFEREASVELPVFADAVQIRRCLANLIGNALKFASRGTTVSVAIGRHGEYWRATVEDQGPGIPVEDLPQVFDRYFQSAHHQALARGGTGIGLALVRELVELHGGKVGIASALGQGTRVWFDLPVATGDVVPETAPGPRPLATDQSLPTEPWQPVRAETSAAGKTLLIVDDNQELRAFLRSQLEHNYRVLEAADGEAALALTRAEAPDIIVTDLMMPVLDGHGFVAALRADPSIAFIPVLMLSARGQKRDIVGGLSAGADDYLPKPFDSAELVARLAALLAAQQRLARRLRELASTTSEARPAETHAGTGVGAGKRRDSFAERLDACLEQHLADTDLGVESLAEKMFMDRSTLFRKCQEAHRCAPADYLRQYRLQRAHELLKQSAGSVSEVAYAVGYDSLSHFSRSFKAAYGVSPSALSRN